MIPNEYNRSVATGLWLALLMTSGVAGFLRGTPIQVAGHPRALSSDGTFSAPFAAQQATPLPGLAVDATCRVVGGPLALDVVDADTVIVSGRLQNAGVTPATIDAIELGWSGPATLLEVELGPLTKVSVKNGASPALVPLGPAGPLALDAGQTVDIRLRFYHPRPDAGWRTGPLVVLAREGCEVALRWPEAPACPVTIAGPALSMDRPARVTFELANPGAEPVDMATLEMTWPWAVNGAIVGLQWDEGGVATTFDPPPMRGPVAWDLARLFGQAVIPPQAKVVIGIDFEQPAAHTGYALRMVTRQGCVVTASTWLGVPNGGTAVDRFDSHDHVALLTLANRGGIAQTLSSLDVFWVPGLNGALSRVLIDGHNVWDAGSDVSPTTIVSLTRSTVIQPGQVVEVALQFKSPEAAPAVARDGPRRGRARALDGAPGPDPWPASGPTGDDDPVPVATDGLAGDFTFVAGFQGGEQAVFSTLRGGAFGCRVWAAEEFGPVDGAPKNEVSAAVLNTGGSAVLRTLTLDWPERNGALTGVYFGTTQLLEQPRLPASEPLMLSFAAEGAAMVPRATTQRLRLTFAQSAAAGGYTAVLGFHDLSDNPCSELRVTSPPIKPECGKLSFVDNLAFKGRHIELELRNDSPDPLRISDLNMTWLEEINGMALVRLTTISLADGARDWAIWSAPGAGPLRPPVTLRPDAQRRPAVVEAGTQVVLRLTFDAPPRDTPEFRSSFKLTLGFVEGCRAAFPLDGPQIASQTVDFVGVVRDLPRRSGVETLFGCCWQVLDRQNRVMMVDVDPQTRLLPAAIKPKRGDIVEVNAIESPDRKTYFAKQITVRTRLPEETIVGVVDKIEPEPVPPALAPRWLSVDGTAVIVTDQTVIDDVRRLRTGSRVMVRGTRDANHELAAAEIDVLDLALGDAVSIRGAVRSVADGGEPGLQSVWLVDRYEVEIPEGAVIEGLPPSGRPGLGWEARVEGEQVESDVIRATAVKLLPAPQVREVDGIVIALPTGGGVRGNWIARPAQGAGDGTDDFVFTVESSAVLDTRAAPAMAGMRLHVVMRDKGVETPVAVSVRLDWP